MPAEELAGARAPTGAYVLAAGRLSPEKGLDVAIEATALTGVPLGITGDGPSGADLAALVGRLGAPVELLGRVARDEMQALLRGAAALVLNSRSHEFLALSVLEAMGAAVPGSPPAAAGCRLIGEERCVPLGDAAALAERMGELWSDPWRRREEGEQLLAVATEHRSRSATSRTCSAATSGPAVAARAAQ